MHTPPPSAHARNLQHLRHHLPSAASLGRALATIVAPRRVFQIAAICTAACLVLNTVRTFAVNIPPDIEIVKDVVYSHVDGEDVSLDAYLQPSPGPHPAAVFVHGGGYVAGDKAPCPHYILEPFLGHGYSVFSINYRLAPKYKFPAQIDDVVVAIRFIRAHAAERRIDPNRLVLTGESAGGLITGLVGIKLAGNDRLAAVVPMCGEFDLQMRTSEDPCHVNGQTIPCPPGGCFSPGLTAFFGFDSLETDEQRATLHAASTVENLHPNMPPYLLIHGTRDFGVPYEQSVSLQQAMNKAGGDCTLLPVIKGGHGNWTPEQWQAATDAELDWLDQKIGKP